MQPLTQKLAIIIIIVLGAFSGILIFIKFTGITILRSFRTNNDFGIRNELKMRGD